MRCCKICPSTAIVGVMALAGLGWAGFTTMTGRCPLTGRCTTETNAAALVSTETDDCSSGGCCPLSEGAEAGTMMNASLGTAEGSCETACETACDEAAKAACESSCTGEKTDACTGEKPAADAPIASDAPTGPSGG